MPLQKKSETIAKLLENIDVAMFTTVGAEGYLVSRPLSTQKASFDGERVWFFVEADSPKVAEIRRHKKVNLAYASKDKNTYVSLAGDARINKDKDKIDELWSDAYKAFFPKGKTDPNLALLEVQVRTVEYWDGPGSWIGKAVSFAIARITKNEEVMGKNRIIDLKSSRRPRLPPSHKKAKKSAKKAPAKKAAAKKKPAAKKAPRKAAKKAARRTSVR